jgi:hypothetical protein
MQHAVEGDPFFSAKKFIRDLDDQGYEFTHVISPEGKVTYLPQHDPRHLPKDEMGEDAPAVAKFAGGLGVGLVAAAGAPAIVGILGPLLGIPFAAYGAYSAAKLGMKGVEKLWDMASEKLGGDDKVEQYTQAKIAKLPPNQAQAAQAVIKQVAESRKSTAPKLQEEQTPEKELERLKLRQDSWKKAPLKDQAATQSRIRELEKQIKDRDTVDEALLSATARLKENEYFCMLDKQVKIIPEGYKRNKDGYLVRK